jgi:hypothetical protein
MSKKHSADKRDVILSPAYEEHFRRALMLGNTALDIIAKQHPDNWREVLQQEAPNEFKDISEVNEYLESLTKAMNCIT